MPEYNGSTSSQTKALTAREMKPEPRRVGHSGTVSELLFLQVCSPSELLRECLIWIA